jgi:hypothetical protein
MIDWLKRERHSRTAPTLAGVAAALFGVLIFLAPTSVAAHGNNASALITLCSVFLVADGLVLILGPDKINEMVKRNRRY